MSRFWDKVKTYMGMQMDLVEREEPIAEEAKKKPVRKRKVAAKKPVKKKPVKKKPTKRKSTAKKKPVKKKIIEKQVVQGFEKPLPEPVVEVKEDAIEVPEFEEASLTKVAEGSKIKD